MPAPNSLPPKIPFPAVEALPDPALVAPRSSVFAMRLASEPTVVQTTVAPRARMISKLVAVFGRAALDFALTATIVFLLVRAVPGDLASVVLGEQADPAARAALNHRLGLDRSFAVQYAQFWGRIVQLDWGASLGRPGVMVSHRLYHALAPTVRLALLAVGIAAAWGVCAGLYAARYEGRMRNRVLRALIASAASLPLLATAPALLYLLCVRLQWLPLPGDSNARFAGLLFASALLALPLGAHVARAVHANLLELRRGACLRVARAKGASSARTWFVHALPQTAGVVLTLVGAQLGAVLGGAMVIERLFERRGLGTLILESYRSRDLVMLEASVLVSALFFVSTQALFHAVFLWIDPRARNA